MTHTPGPWRISEERSIDNVPSIEGRAFDGSWKYICQKIHGGSPQQMESNAHLIAAAPDLLEACKAARKRIVHKFECCGTNPAEEWAEKGSQNFNNCSCEIRVIDAAIAKAKGKP